MSNNTEFRIDWELHELGEREKPPLTVSPDLVRLSPREFADAITMGALPANAVELVEDEAA